MFDFIDFSGNILLYEQVCINYSFCSINSSLIITISVSLIGKKHANLFSCYSLSSLIKIEPFS